MNDRDDPILEAFLAEVLGGQRPPDHSARILQTWQERHGAPSASANRPLPLPPHLLTGEPVAPPAPPVQISPQPLIQLPQPTAMRSHTRRHNAWSLSTVRLIVASSAALLLLACGAFVLWKSVPRDKENAGGNGGIVQHPQTPVTPPREPREKENGSAPRIAKTSPKDKTNSPAKERDSVGSQVPSPHEFAVDPPSGVPASGARDVKPAPSHYSASPDSEVIAFINTELKKNWTENHVSPAAEATDSEWCRRTFLRLLGRIPTVDELERFVGATKAGKRERLVDQLLGGEDYREEFVRQWSSILANALIGRSGGTGAESLASREGLLQYLRQSLAHDKPYDKLAYELISATGSSQPGAEDYNGAVNYLLANMSDKGTLATTRTSQVFLGVHLQCAQCHQHPSNTLAQDQYWQLNAFFRQMAVERDRQSGAARLVNRDFQGERGDPAEAEIYFENAAGQLKVAYPVFFVDGTDLPHSGVVEEVDRRTQLAEMVQRTDNLGRAAVNRLWAHFCGFGFTKPVDDIGPHNPPSHPQLLDRLASEFAGHGYDLKKVMRWIALSDAFNRSSKIAPANAADAPDLGTVPLFTRYYTRQMQAEELYQSLQMLASARRTGSISEQEQAKLAWLGQFSRNMGTDEGMEEHSFNGSIPQSLFLMNGDLTRHATSTEHGSLLARVAHSKLKPEQKIEHLFESALSRKPTKRELTAARELLATRGSDELSVLQDLWWALLNSNEFILDH